MDFKIKDTIRYDTKLLKEKYGGNAKEIIKHLEKAENEIKLK